ncbi:MAG: glycine cleavage system aminomethyltransferase GcvT [Proteobacteria bacterium]|nr:glycine cleavage system aminomethyltransferase GcvT [Pseudomonadota bacterium]
MGHQTPLYNEHLALHAKIVDFAGWDMPIHYGSQVEEHHQVRRDAGMFDVSHMTIVDLRGLQVRAFLQHLIANNVDKLKQHQALYTCMLNAEGGVIDDLIVYFMDEEWFRMVVNAATREKDMAWINTQAAAFSVTVTERPELAMIAVQGPHARERVYEVLAGSDAHGRANVAGGRTPGATNDSLREQAAQLKPFYAAHAGGIFIGRTGYTGEDGFEILLPGKDAAAMWRALLGQGVKPIGLGARDTLRLEAGMNLYGTDMDETISPLECGLEWTVAWEPAARKFIGRDALEKQKAQGVARKLVGLVLEDKGVLRNHQKVIVEGIGAGEITSGSFAPTLGKAIALARVPAATGAHVAVDIRGTLHPARVVKPPFVRNNKSLI